MDIITGKKAALIIFLIFVILVLAFIFLVTVKKVLLKKGFSLTRNKKNANELYDEFTYEQNDKGVINSNYSSIGNNLYEKQKLEMQAKNH